MHAVLRALRRASVGVHRVVGLIILWWRQVRRRRREPACCENGVQHVQSGAGATPEGGSHCAEGAADEHAGARKGAACTDCEGDGLGKLHAGGGAQPGRIARLSRFLFLATAAVCLDYR